MCSTQETLIWCVSLFWSEFPRILQLIGNWLTFFCLLVSLSPSYLLSTNNTNKSSIITYHLCIICNLLVFIDYLSFNHLFIHMCYLMFTFYLFISIYNLLPIFYYYLFLGVWVFCLHVYLCTMCVQYPCGTEEDIGSPGTRVIDSCVPSCVC